MQPMQQRRWFSLELDDSNATKNAFENPVLVEVERDRGDCCGCCGRCGGRRDRRRGDGWGDAFGPFYPFYPFGPFDDGASVARRVLGMIGFLLAVSGLFTLSILAWSLNSLDRLDHPDGLELLLVDAFASPESGE